MARRSRRGDWITPCDRKLPKGGLLQWPRTVNWFQLFDMEWGWCVTVFACVSARILWVSWCLQKQEMRRERIATAERRRGEIFEVRLVTRVRSFEDADHVDHVDPAKAFRKRKASKTNQAWDWPRFCRVTVWCDSLGVRWLVGIELLKSAIWSRRTSLCIQSVMFCLSQ